MTTETTETNWREQLRQQQDADNAQLVADILGAGTDLDEAQVTYEYDLQEPVRLFSRSDQRHTREVVRVRVSATAFPAASSDEDAETYYRAEGYSYSLTKNGQRSKAENPSWSYLPEELAKVLLQEVAPRVDRSSSASRQHYIDTGRYLLVDPADADVEA